MTLFDAGAPAEIVRLIEQLAAILLITNLCGWVASRVGQPRVVGEIAGGLLLGSLVFGSLFPGASAVLFPPLGLHGLEVVSNVGLVLFLLLIGAELDLEAARQGRKAWIAITAGSVAVPFVLGIVVSPLLLARFGTAGESRIGFALFAGIAMSITALPVLARIVQERSGTVRAVDAATATVALVCAAANDLLAWSLLAVTLTLIHGGGVAETLVRLVMLVGYVGLMLLVVRPLAGRLVSLRQGPKIWAWVAGMVAVAFLSARITEALGVHAFFGAFLAGVCVPRVQPLEKALDRLLQPVVHVTLPVFFAMTGLRMQREMFSGSGLGWLAVVLLVAVAGKIGGAALAAKGSGMPWRKAGEIGVLLNTRGLVELVVLNIGYKEGILSPLLFTLFVLMAVVTTAMTVPLLNVLER